MEHADHLRLIKEGVNPPAGTWADFGSGRGAFTLALAELLGPGGVIHSIDRDRGALRSQENAMRQRYPQIELHLQQADFSRQLDLPSLDGALMANSLHFQPDPLAVLRNLWGYLKPGSRLVIVEYNLKRGNYAVPYPIPYTRFVTLADGAGFTNTRLLATRPSSTMGEIYSAVTIKKLSFSDGAVSGPEIAYAHKK